MDIYRTKRFRLKANTEHFASATSLSNSTSPLRMNGDVERATSNWNCDGEVINDLEVTVQAHCQLVDVFRRGIHDPTDDGDDTCCF